MTIVEKLKLCLRILTEKDEEDRCPTCGEGTDCPAYNSGVAYPCPHYRPRER